MILNCSKIITMNENKEIIEDGAIVIEDDKIIDIGKQNIINKKFNGFHKKIDCKESVAFPGFINTHTHTALCLVRGMAEELGKAPAYTPYLPQSTDLSESEIYILSLLGAVENLMFGSTLIVDNYIHSMSSVKAFADLGIRAIVSERVHDARFSALPEKKYIFDTKFGLNLLDKNIELIEKWNNKRDGRIKCFFGPHAPDTCSIHLLNKIREKSEEFKVGVTIHLSQSENEVKYIKENHNISPVEYLAKTDILSKDLLAAHCIYVDKKDIKILAENDVNICHIPEGNAKGGMMAPVPKMIKKNVNITLGTDNMQGDIVETMRFAICVSRILNNSASLPNSYDILKMATRNPAVALGVEDELGSIEVGKKADLVLFDFDKPHLTPCINPIGNLIHTGSGSDVDKVIIDGKIVVENGEVQTLDVKQLIKEANEVAQKRWSAEGVINYEDINY